MWTPATRGRMAEFEKKTKRCPTDLTDEEWAQIGPFLPGAAGSATVITDSGGFSVFLDTASGGQAQSITTRRSKRTSICLPVSPTNGA